MISLQELRVILYQMFILRIMWTTRSSVSNITPLTSHPPYPQSNATELLVATVPHYCYSLIAVRID